VAAVANRAVARVNMSATKRISRRLEGVEDNLLDKCHNEGGEPVLIGVHIPSLFGTVASI
jgi:hypothetical protein